MHTVEAFQGEIVLSREGISSVGNRLQLHHVLAVAKQMFSRSLPLFLVQENDKRDRIITRLATIMQKGNVCADACAASLW